MVLGPGGSTDRTGVGSYTLSNGTLTVMNEQEQIGEYASGTFNQSGGTNTAAVLLVGGEVSGTYIFSGGTLAANDGEGVGNWVGTGGVGVGTFEQTGGVQTVSPLAAPGFQYAIVIGRGANVGGSGNYLLSGTGSLTVNGSILVTSPIAGPSSTLSVSSGSMYVSGGIAVGSGNGTISYGGSFTQTGGTVTLGGLGINSGTNFSLSGGTLNVASGYFTTASSVVVGNGSTPTTLNLTGGSSNASYTFAQGLSISSAATLTGGGTITNSSSSAPVTVYGAIAPTASQNSLSILGSFTLAPTTTTLIEEVGSTPTFGSVTSSGNMALAGALALYEDAANEATTTAGQSFIILQTTGSGVLSGAFSNIASGQTLTTTDGTASFVVTVNEGTDGDVVLSDFQMVPEPGAVGVIARRRWRW